MEREADIQTGSTECMWNKRRKWKGGQVGSQGTGLTRCDGSKGGGVEAAAGNSSQDRGLSVDPDIRNTRFDRFSKKLL